MKTIRILGIALVAVALAGCATALPETTANTAETGGFFWGLWTGFIAPWAFIGSLFSDNIAVYHTPNSGGWYDFGFLIGIGAFTGGASSAR